MQHHPKHARFRPPARRSRSALVAGLLALCWLALLPAIAHAQDDGDPIAEPPLVQPVQAADGSALPPVIINEIHAKPELDTQRLEFIELYNGGSEPVSLGFWTLRGGIDYTFGAGTVIPPRGYLLLAENPAALQAAYGAQAAGAFTGNLALEGEQVTLRNAGGLVVDEVEYQNGFPWPTVGRSPALSIQLLNPAFDNALPGAWRSGEPTPGRVNARLLSNAPPFVASVWHEPAQPAPGQPVTVYAAARDPEGIGSMKVAFQDVQPGNYIRLSDPVYNDAWVLVDMAPTGRQDEQGNDIYAVEMPADLQQNRHLIRYRIYATDSTWKRAILPYGDDPQPNFAWFVYGDAPRWPASLTGSSPDVHSFDFGSMRALPIMQFIARREDVADALFLPDSSLPSGYMGNEEYWLGTLVYNNVVYDHVRFRARGGLQRYATGKTNWKIDFHTGHHLQMADNYGRPYGIPRDKLNLGSVLQQTHRQRRGEQGMFESMTYRLFNIAGVAAPTTDFIHWRVVTDAQEYTTQYRGDFWGLYITIEQPDERFLKEHGLPDGNLYKMENYQGELQNLGRDGPADGSDLGDFMYSYTHGPSVDWWRRSFDLEGYYSFRAILEFTHNYDVDAGKNYLYYRNPETGKWSIFPWDVDLTWYTKMPGTGVDPFWGPVLSQPDFNLEYQNRLRELRDLLLNQEQINLMLAEHAGWIDSPQGGASMVDADRFLWDYNPIYQTRYIDPERSKPGHFYFHVDEHTFAAMVEQMRQYTAERLAWIDATLLTDVGMAPFTPGLYYEGAAGFPVDGLRFVAGQFADPQGPGTFAAMEWRIAEVTDPAAPAYSAGAPVLYEIDAVWESGPQTTYTPVMTPPPGVIEAGHAYRVRVRMRDTSGRWSHWSAPVAFVAAPAAAPVETDLVINEIMYHPAPWGGLPEGDLEFIELKNLSDRHIPLRGMRITGGIDFEFDFEFNLEPFKFLVLAKQRSAFEQRYPYVPFGEYRRSLSNGGDTITLLDAWGRTIAEVAYDDSDPWPESADGDGYSLTYNPLAGRQNDPAAWGASRSVGGSPGWQDPVDVYINEVILFPENARAVELHNPSAQAVDVSFWYISDNQYDPRKVRLPDGSRIPPQGYLVIDAAQLATSSYDGPLRIDPNGRTSLLLTAGRPDGWIGQYQSDAAIPYAEAGVSYGRVVDSLGRAHMVAQEQPTLGAPNAGVRVGPVVVSAIHYFPGAAGSAPVEYIELANRTNATVPLYAPGNPELTWQVQGASFSIPPGTELLPGARLLLTPLEPAAACALYGRQGLARVLGPAGQPLSNSGQEVALIQPVVTGNRVVWVTVDSVTYRAQSPWPAQAAGQGAALQRIGLASWGGDPANWQITAALPGPGAPGPVPVSLCGFEARRIEGSMVITWTLDAPPAGDIAGFTLLRSTTLERGDAVPVVQRATTEVAGGAANGPVLVYTAVDPDAQPGPVYYWLEAGAGDATLPIGRTAPVAPWGQVYLPLVRR